MSNDTVSSLDENTRRYYLDVMGVQCWQLLDAPQPVAVQGNDDLKQGSNRDVAAQGWPQLENEVQSCVDCPLHKTRKQPIVGRGNTEADLLFVLFSPVQSEDESGVLCNGEANVLLGKMLAAINISIESVYITSLLKCSVPASHTVSPEEMQSCNTYLQQQIQLVQPKLVIVLGEATAQYLLQKMLSLDDFRAMNEDMTQQINSIPLFVSYSPEELLQRPEFKRSAWSDLQQMQKILGSMDS